MCEGGSTEVVGRADKTRKCNNTVKKIITF